MLCALCWPVTGHRVARYAQLPGQLQAQILSRAALASSATSPAQTELATFAAGCFWGVELAFQRLPGLDLL